MTWELVPFNPEHAKAIIDDNRRIQESWISDDEIEDLIGEKLGSFSYTILVDGDPVACAGVIIGMWNVGNAWALLSSKFYSHKVKVFRAMKYGLETCIADHGMKRVQAYINPEDRRAIEFIECFGFECEGIMRKAGPNGTDYLMYARIM